MNVFRGFFIALIPSLFLWAVIISGCQHVLHAQEKPTFDWKALSVAAGGLVADDLSSHRFSQHAPTPRCDGEGNTAMRLPDGTWNGRKALLGDAILLSTLFLSAKAVHRTHSRWMHRTVSAVSYAYGAWRGTKGVRNFARCGW